MRRIYERYSSATMRRSSWPSRSPGARYPHHPGFRLGPAAAAYDFEILVDGAAKFAALERDLAAATDTIDIMYYSWERDALTAELTRILLERMHAGVEVRMLNDLFGCLGYGKDEIRQLKAAGAKVLFDVSDIRSSTIATTARSLSSTGCSLHGRHQRGSGVHRRQAALRFMRDTHCRFHGPAVADLQKLFAIRWLERAGEDLFTERFFPAEYPEEGRRTLAQTVSQGVEAEWDPAAERTKLASEAPRTESDTVAVLHPTPAIYQIMIDQALAAETCVS